MSINVAEEVKEETKPDRVQDEETSMRPYLPLLRCCEPCTSTKKSGGILRTFVVVFNILLWFAGCAIVSVAVWLLFIDHATITYYITFGILDTALHVVLVAGILFLVVSFIGTCGANIKNQMMVTVSVVAILLLIIAEIIGLIFYYQNHGRIINEVRQWYTNVFLQYPLNNGNQAIVDHVQTAMKCCGLKNQNDFLRRLGNITKPPNSCSDDPVQTAVRVLQPIHPEGCLDKIHEHVVWILEGWPIKFTAVIVFIFEFGILVPAIMYLIYLFRRGKFEYDDDDNEESGLMESLDTVSLRGVEDLGKSFPFIGDLPYPKLYRIVRNLEDGNFGFRVMFDDVRKCHVIIYVEAESCADFAGVSTGSQIVEINGVMAQNATSEEIDYTLAMSSKEVRILIVDAMTCALYEDHRVSINLRNVEGVTEGDLEYKPRLCEVNKHESGFGFNLLYLEDRKGEYIEDLTSNGSGEKAGLKIGDRIVEVNGVNIEREKSREVVDRIRKSGSVVYLLVVDPKTDGYFRKKAVTITASLDAEYFTGRAGQRISTPKAKRKSRKDVKPRYCRLVKRAREEFGLYVVIDNARIGQVIRWVDCGGAADRAGLRIGDRIVEVNGQNVEYEPHQRLIAAIGLSKSAAHIIVVDEDYDRVYQRNKPRLCRIFKEHSAFGFCVEYHPSKDGHYVEEVDVGGPAERAGLKVGDRVVQMNGVNVDRDSHPEVLQRLRSCESEVVLLVIDTKSSRHYKQIVQFKNTGMDDIDYDAISIPEEPIFIPKDPDSDNESFRSPTLSMADSISMAETRSYASFASDMSLRGDIRAPIIPGAPRQCILRKTESEEHGFFLAVDRDRNGQIIRRVVKGGAADLAGLMNEDRILCINGDRVEGMDHEEVVTRIRESGNTICFTVIDERSDQAGPQGRPYLFRIMKDKGGYGFYLWHDDNGHYVEDVTVGSPADKAGLRCGDRLIEINSVNIEGDSHEDVFYRIKACVNVVTLLAVDAKTYSYCKKMGIDVSASKAENRFSGETNWKPGGDGTKSVPPSKPVKLPKKRVKHEVSLKKEKGEEGYGFHLAYSNSFMDAKDTAGGHVVHWVGKGGPADMVGVRDGDRIICVNDVNVESEDHEQVMVRIHGNGKNVVKLVIEYEEDANAPHDIEISKENGTFGFYLWFDENGHYIEDVTIGSTADVAGLKIGDRLIQVNGANVESDSHENAVSRVRDSGDVVKLNVISVMTEEVREVAVPRTCHIAKKQGSFGFCIQEDGRGLYIEYVQASSSAEAAGVHMGDRLLEINGDSVNSTTHSDAIGMIVKSGSAVTLTLLSVKKEVPTAKKPSHGLKLSHEAKGSDNRSSINTIFHQLLGKEEIDYVVEKKEYGKNKEQSREKPSGTDLRSPSKDDDDEKEPTQPTKNNNKKQKKLKRASSVGKKRRIKSFKKDAKSALKPRYSKGGDNVAFVAEENEDETQIADENIAEGHFLDFTLKKVEKSATTKRRKLPSKNGSRDPRSVRMKDIESRIASQDKHAKTGKTNYSSNSSRRTHKFHLATSGQLKWSFEETDSRRPGHVVMRSIGDDPNQILELDESVADDDAVFANEQKTLETILDEDLMMTPGIETTLDINKAVAPTELTHSEETLELEVDSQTAVEILNEENSPSDNSGKEDNAVKDNKKTSDDDKFEEIII